MVKQSSSFTLRLSRDLRLHMEAAAAKRGVSLASEIVAACWLWLEESATDMAVILDGIGSAPVASENLAAAPKPDMQALRDICAGNLPKGSIGFAVHDSLNHPPIMEVAICGKTWWEDGEHYECLMDAGIHAKHGLRGMVRRLDN